MQTQSEEKTDQMPQSVPNGTMSHLNTHKGEKPCKECNMIYSSVEEYIIGELTRHMVHPPVHTQIIFSDSLICPQYGINN